jgi:hypothetical protein
MKKIEGWRTFIVVLVGILMLVLGLFFVKDDHRKEVYSAFSLGLVGLASAYATKSIGSKAVAGDGIVGGFQNLMTAKKPGETAAGG